MLFRKAVLLIFTTLALGGAVQGVAIHDPIAARELDIITGNVALNMRGDDLVALGLNQQMVERDPRRKPKAASPAALKSVRKSSSQIAAATKELQRFRANHKKVAKKPKSKSVGSWWGRDNAELSEREIVEERARKAQANADLRKTLRVVNQHLLAAANNLRAVQRREVGDKVLMHKRQDETTTDSSTTDTEITTTTDSSTTDTETTTTTDSSTTDTETSTTTTDSSTTDTETSTTTESSTTTTDVLPTSTDTESSITIVLPTSTDTVSSTTDVLPTSTDVSSTETSPSITIILPTDSTTSTSTTSAPTTTTTPAPNSVAALVAAIRAFVAMIRALIRELVASILDSFGSAGGADRSVLREVSPGLSAIFSATSDTAKSISPNAAAVVDPILGSIRIILSKYGFEF